MTPDSTLGDFFRADIDIPEIPFGEMLWETAQRFPEKEAVIFQGQKISYRELDGLTNSIANALSGIGVKKGDRVALYMTNRPEYIISFYAAARLGAVATPLNPPTRKTRSNTNSTTPKPACWSCRSRSTRWSNRCAQRCRASKKW